MLRERAKVRAERTAKVSAIRGDETEVSVAVCCDEDSRSSMIQPSPANPDEEFQAASVKIVQPPGLLGFGSHLIKGLDNISGGGDCALCHSLASEIAFWIVSSGEKLLFSKIR